MRMIGTMLQAAVITSCCLLCVACGGPDTPNTVPEKPLSSSLGAGQQPPVDTLVATASAVRSTLSLPARITYAEDGFSKVSSPLQGRVLDIRARLGDHVKAGEILLVIDSPDIATAYSDYVKEISELGLARRNYDLASELLKVKAIAFKEYKQAENDLNRERAEFAQARDRLLSLRVPATELEKPLARQYITSRFELRSPLTGTVVERTVTPGQSVGPGTDVPLFIVANLNRLQVVADVYERDSPLMKVGQVIRLTVEAYPSVEFPAIVVFTGDVVDPDTRTIKVRAVVDNTDRRLKPQMFGRVTIPVEGSTQAILVPKRAVSQINGRSVVYVESAPGGYVPRVVKVEESSGDSLRVLEGLVAGERIMSQRPTTLPPG